MLCPGPVNTNFNNTANVKFSTEGLYPRDVAEYALDKIEAGKMIIIPSSKMKAVKILEHFLSEKMLTRLSYNIQSSKDDSSK